MINLFIFLSLFFSSPSAFCQTSQNSEIKVKWYIRKNESIPGKYTITVDARKVNRYIQLSAMRFVVEFRDPKGNLIDRDTVNFISQPSGDKLVSRTHLSGGKISSMTYKDPHPSNTKVTGIKLFYKWDDSSISFEPDPIEEKPIIPALAYGEGSTDISAAP
jgi:hypothetical protein